MDDCVLLLSHVLISLQKYLCFVAVYFDKLHDSWYILITKDLKRNMVYDICPYNCQRRKDVAARRYFEFFTRSLASLTEAVFQNYSSCRKRYFLTSARRLAFLYLSNKYKTKCDKMQIWKHSLLNILVVTAGMQLVCWQHLFKATRILRLKSGKSCHIRKSQNVIEIQFQLLSLELY